MAEHDSESGVAENGITRARMQARLEGLILDNRFTIAVVFPFVGAVTLVASAEGLLPAPLAFNPLLILFGTLVMRSPLLVGIFPQLTRRALAFVGVLLAYTYLIELVGVRTGWPYGTFEYAVQLGPMLFGEVPLALALFFVPLVCNAYLLTLLVLGSRADRAAVRLPLAIACVVAIDVVLDPAAVAIGFWAFESGGFYGVPLSNYLGWVLSGTVAVVVVDLGFDREELASRAEECPFILDDLVSFVLLWGLVNVLYGNWLAVLVAVGFGLALVRTGRFDRTLFVGETPVRFGPP